MFSWLLTAVFASYWSKTFITDFKKVWVGSIFHPDLRPEQVGESKRWIIRNILLVSWELEKGGRNGQQRENGLAAKLSCESRHNQYTREQLRPGLFYTLFSQRWKARELSIYTRIQTDIHTDTCGLGERRVHWDDKSSSVCCRNSRCLRSETAVAS